MGLRRDHEIDFELLKRLIKTGMPSSEIAEKCRCNRSLPAKRRQAAGITRAQVKQWRVDEGYVKPAPEREPYFDYAGMVKRVMSGPHMLRRV